MAGILQIKQGFNILDKTDEKNAQGSDQANDEHAFQNADEHQDQKIHRHNILFDVQTVEQHELSNRWARQK